MLQSCKVTVILGISTVLPAMILQLTAKKFQLGIPPLWILSSAIVLRVVSREVSPVYDSGNTSNHNVNMLERFLAVAHFVLDM